MFIGLFMAILRQLVLEAQDRRASGANKPIFRPGESFVFDGLAVNWLKARSQGLVNAMLAYNMCTVRVGPSWIKLAAIYGERATDQR